MVNMSSQRWIYSSSILSHFFMNLDCLRYFARKDGAFIDTVITLVFVSLERLIETEETVGFVLTRK